MAAPREVPQTHSEAAANAAASTQPRERRPGFPMELATDGINTLRRIGAGQIADRLTQMTWNIKVEGPTDKDSEYPIRKQERDEQQKAKTAKS